VNTTNALILSLALALCACATTADNPETGAATEDAAETTPESEKLAAADEDSAAPDDERLVCRRVQVTGSRFTKRLCVTEREQREMQRRSNEYIDMVRTQGLQAADPRAGGQ